MTQETSSSHAQGAQDLAAYQGLAPGWYFDSADSGLARYWDGTRLLDERRPVLRDAPADDVSSSFDILFEETTSPNGSSNGATTRPVASEDGLVSADAAKVWAKNLLGHDVGPGPRRGSGAGVLTRLLIALGLALVIVAVIDEIGGDSNHLALGTAAVGIFFIVAVGAEATLSASMLGSRSARNRRPQRARRPAMSPPKRRPGPPPPASRRRR